MNAVTDSEEDHGGLLSHYRPQDPPGGGWMVGKGGESFIKGVLLPKTPEETRGSPWCDE